MENMRKAVLEGFSRYEITEDGVIRYKKNGKICPDYGDGKTKEGSKRGYRKIKIYPDNEKVRKVFSVHRLLWMAFMGEIPEGYEVDHINGKRDDNRLDNIRVIPLKANRDRRKYG